MPAVITLKYPGTCAECGAPLPAGSEARYYGRGRLYCVGGHNPEAPAPPPAQVHPLYTKAKEGTGYLSCADTAVLAREALKAAFPQVKFSVRSKTYSGGASIDIRWTDGPIRKDVEGVAKLFEGADFDGMIDLKTSNYHWLTPDGHVAFASTPGTEGSRGLIPAQDEPPPGDAMRVHFQADYIFCRRDISDEASKVAEATAWVYAHCGIRDKTGDAERDRFGNHYVSQLASNMAYDHLEGEDWAVTMDRCYYGRA